MQTMRLGFLIRLSRELKGWSLRDLESKSGVSNALLSQIETGRVRDPSFSRVVAIARALHLKLDRLAKCGTQDSETA
jgi:transcriptional regulator with XRE-family HTH domain